MSTCRKLLRSSVQVGVIWAVVLTTLPALAQTASPVPARPSGSAGGAGIVPRMPGSTLSFDPKKLGSSEVGASKAAAGPGAAAAGTVTPPGAEEIEFKANYDENNDAKCIKLPLNAKINIDFQDAPLDDLIKFIGCITERNFMLKGGVGKGKNITIMSPNKVTVYEAYRAFLAALEVNGLTVVPSGKFLKIEEITKAKQDTLPIFGNGEAFPKEERFVTRLVQLEHIAADEIQATLQKFKTQQGDISVYGPTNTLIITDSGANIVRILRLLKELDVPTGKERIWIRPVEYAEATELVDKLQQVFGTDKGKTAAPRSNRKRNKKKRASASASSSTDRSDESAVTVSKILADERTNQLIIMANRSSYFKLDRLIRKLDVPIPGEGQIHIHYLENADAEEISNTLSNLTQSGGNKRRKSSTSGRKSTNGKSKGGGGGAAALFEGEVKISPHEETNSLVVEASLKDYRNLKQVIQKLDIRRKQVYVEAVIMEITSTKGSNLGVSGSGGAVFSAGGEDVPLLVGAGGLGISGFDPEQLNSGGLAVGLQGPLVDVQPGSAASLGAGALSVPTFGFLVQALQSNSDVNILSTPHILTTDNEEAEIQVGKQIPYRSSGMGGGLGSLASLGGLAGGLGGSSGGGLGSLGALGGLGGLGGFGTVQYIDVDLTLKITPHVNESNFVRLEIEQELEDVETLDENLGPTTSRRRVNNTVVVRDGQPVVIGGLIRDSESEGVSKIPFLGDIPVIGYLFRSTVKSTEKKNLLMVIIPTVIGDPSDLKRLHEQRVDEMREFADELATKKKEYLGEVDYRKKSGVLEEMYKVVSDARAERELLESTTFDRNGLDMVGPPETHEIEYDPYRSGRVEAEEVTPVEAVPVTPEPVQEPVQEPAQESAEESSTDGEQAETPAEPLLEESDVDQVNPQDGE